MTARRGEQWGWLAGWFGGFIWVLILSIKLSIEGRNGPALTGFLLVAVAVVVIAGCAPWRHPQTPYWLLMLPVYAMIFGSIGWALWSFGGLQGLGLNGFSAFMLVPILLPLAIAGKRKWNELG